MRPLLFRVDLAAIVEYAVGCRWRRQMSWRIEILALNEEDQNKRFQIPDPRFLVHSGDEDLELREESPEGWEMRL
ncbi:hypothetical protein CGRA01v4_10342 [Colletotrichum graminicola]|nr:hypothetical protein CGRA01v4_10342 [Colletotrichum graminicola]